MFSTANQAYLENVNVSLSLGGEPTERTVIGAIEFIERNEGWVRYEATKGEGEYWVKEEDLSYNFPTTVYDY